jgi:hypothetical protein
MAANGHVSVLELLPDAKANLETPNKDCTTPAWLPLQMAMWVCCNLEIPNKYGDTPAFIAAHKGQISMLELLRDIKADLKISSVWILTGYRFIRPRFIFYFPPTPARGNAHGISEKYFYFF